MEESDLLTDPNVPLAKNSLTFGRLPGTDVTLADRSVSKLHARLGLEAGEWVLEDCDSSNGVKVNGEEVKRSRLQDGDLFELGRASFRLRLGHPDQ